MMVVSSTEIMQYFFLRCLLLSALQLQVEKLKKVCEKLIMQAVKS